LTKQERETKIVFDEKERANELAFDKKKLLIRQQNVAVAQQQLDIRKTNIELDKQPNARAPAPKQPNARAPPRQPNNVGPAARQQHNARAPPRQEHNARAAPPNQSGKRLLIVQVIEDMKLDNWMREPDFCNIGRILVQMYRDYYGVRPKQDRYYTNMYFVTDRRMMEKVVVEYDNKKGSR